MIKRVVWMGSGYGLGLGTSWWVKRKVSRTIEAQVDRYVPPVVRQKAGTAASAVNRKAQAVNERVAPQMAKANAAVTRVREAAERRN